VVCGNTLGRYCFIGAGAVVTKDVKDFALVVGNPARQIGWMCQCGERLTVAQGKGHCARCGSNYLEQNGVLTQQ
jgi:UDP-2-acetamido-3-amino-2,3-dideoxy-glucuronate N-acetyltransferase